MKRRGPSSALPPVPLPEGAPLERDAGEALFAHLADTDLPTLEKLVRAVNTAFVTNLPGSTWEQKLSAMAEHKGDRAYIHAHFASVLAFALARRADGTVDEGVAAALLGGKDAAGMQRFVERAQRDVASAYRILHATHARVRETAEGVQAPLPPTELHRMRHVDLGAERPLPPQIPATALAARRAYGTESIIATSTHLSGLTRAPHERFAALHLLRQVQDVTEGIHTLHRSLLTPLAEAFPVGRSVRTRFAYDPDAGVYAPYLRIEEDADARARPEDRAAQILLALHAAAREGRAPAVEEIAPLGFDAMLGEAALLRGELAVPLEQDDDADIAATLPGQRPVSPERLDALRAWLAGMQEQPSDPDARILPLLRLLSVQEYRAADLDDRWLLTFQRTQDVLVLRWDRGAASLQADFYERWGRESLPQWRMRIVAHDGAPSVVDASTHPVRAAMEDAAARTLASPAGGPVREALGPEGMDAFVAYAGTGVLRLSRLMAEADMQRAAARLSRIYTVPELYGRPLAELNLPLRPAYAALVPPVRPPFPETLPDDAAEARVVGIGAGISATRISQLHGTGQLDALRDDAPPRGIDLHTLFREHAAADRLQAATVLDAQPVAEALVAMPPAEVRAAMRARAMDAYEARAQELFRALPPGDPDATLRLLQQVKFSTFLAYVADETHPLCDQLRARIGEALEALSTRLVQADPVRKRRPPTPQKTNKTEPFRAASAEELAERDADTRRSFSGITPYLKLTAAAWAFGMEIRHDELAAISGKEEQRSSLSPAFAQARLLARITGPEDAADIHPPTGPDAYQLTRLFEEVLEPAFVSRLLRSPRGDMVRARLGAVLERVYPDIAASYLEEFRTYEQRAGDVAASRATREAARKERQRRRRRGELPLPELPPRLPAVEPPPLLLLGQLTALGAVARLVDADVDLDGLLASVRGALGYPEGSEELYFRKEVRELLQRRGAGILARKASTRETLLDQAYGLHDKLEQMPELKEEQKLAEDRLAKQVGEMPSDHRVRTLQERLLLAVHVRTLREGGTDLRVYATKAAERLPDALRTAGALPWYLRRLAETGGLQDDVVLARWVAWFSAQAEVGQRRLTDTHHATTIVSSPAPPILALLESVGYTATLDGGQFPDGFSALFEELDRRVPALRATLKGYLRRYAEQAHTRARHILESEANPG